ncbi:TetR family transcriptional regulator [Novosphingobium endophyticum]|uniref:TetR family transcriptional regulator n=1 Tax=Novosphingobium endophyticum TaxID=1955250 RepID=A0A916TVK5_9SPHN|nr:TetR/AcrR family transcriptional regulator [Novosphingobium endophyticum]GGC15382.1 TetR family transcriptional regulator [Novosphingobium endophyticum]
MPKRGQPTRKDEAEARRSQILDQAIRLIGFKGYRGFTLQQLASQCGLTNGGVLYHFPSKEDVLTGVLGELERRMVKGIMTHIGGTVGIPGEGPLSRDVVLQIMRGMLSQTSAEAEVIRLLTMLQIEALDPDHPAHERIMQNSRSTFDRFSALFEPLCHDPRVVARQALAMMNGLYLLWLEDPCFDLIVEWDRAIEKLLPDNVRGKGE